MQFDSSALTSRPTKQLKTCKEFGNHIQQLY
jgi:hypothetical protein